MTFFHFASPIVFFIFSRIIIYLLLVTVITGLYCVPPVYAEPIMKFQQFSREDGLTSDNLYVVTEDKNGFIWFGGAEGLQRFDGNEFRKFSKRAIINNKLSNELVFSLMIDHLNNVWIGTNSGLNLYDQNIESVSEIRLNLRNESDGRIGMIRALYESSDNRIWIGSYAGLTQYNPKSKKISHTEMPAVRTIAEIDKNTLLIGTLSNGLHVFDRHSEKYNRIFLFSEYSRKQSLTGNFNEDLSIIDIFQDNLGQFLVSTWGDGIYIFDPELQSVKKIETSTPIHRVRQVRQENSGKYWIATDAGVFISNSLNDTDNSVAKVDNQIFSKVFHYRNIHINSQNQAWIATYGSGVFFRDKRYEQFEHYSNNLYFNGSLAGQDISCIEEISENKILICDFLPQIHVIDQSTNKVETFDLKIDNEKYFGYLSEVVSTKPDEFLARLSDGKTVFFKVNKIEVNIALTEQYEFLKNFSIISQSSHSSTILATNRHDNRLVVLEQDNIGNWFVKAKSDTLINSTGASYVDSNKNTIFLFHANRELLELEVVNSRINTIAQSSLVLNDSTAHLDFDINNNLWISTQNSGIYSLRNADLIKEKVLQK